MIDEKGEPMPYVNVVLLSLPDSAFVQGAMTDEQGVFKIVTNVNNGVFKVGSMGYQTLYINAGEGLTIQMKEDAQLLSEVVVKGLLPKTHVKGDAMRTTVAGTILEKAGTVSDASFWAGRYGHTWRIAKVALTLAASPTQTMCNGFVTITF